MITIDEEVDIESMREKGWVAGEERESVEPTER